ncbi:hypothetical protein LTS08_002131 [Lithohypha guttulata]|nr:hypothetical protein LTS08_002131 [Lithohypha guttulata]
MSSKRRNTSSPECETPVKRRNILPPMETAMERSPSESSVLEPDFDTKERPQLDVYTGQTGAFPGLDVSNGELFYGPANDGIDYLRMVRSEASGIPHLLTAQAKKDTYIDDNNNGDEDGGYWDGDGTYTAMAAVDTQSTDNAMPKAQIECYQSLLAQFALVRATLNCVPPLEAVEKLTSSQPISFPPDNKNARRTWLHCLKVLDPNPVQVACIDEDSVLQLIRFLTTKLQGLLQVNNTVSLKRTNAWIWAVLGRCPDRGRLGSEEISDLRQLAQKVTDMRSLLERRSQQKSEETVVEDDGSEHYDEDQASEDEATILADIETARKRLVGDPDGTEGKHPSIVNGEKVVADQHREVKTAIEETLIAFDMVLTVVGELYGQRDLLERRRAWAE